MQCKRITRIAVSSAVFLTLTGCLPGQADHERHADFFVVSAGPSQAGSEGYRPTGGGWRSHGKVEFSIWNEPNGPGSASTQWKRIFEVDVDAHGMFGFDAGAAFYPVRRSICGTPELQQSMVFMAKNLATGTIRIRQVPVDLYFTFQPCS